MTSDDKSRLKKETMERVRKVQAILRRWDPMDLAPGSFAPADEYDSYALQIVSRIVKGCSVEELVDHLRKLRTGMVCMRDKSEFDKNFACEMIDALRNDSD